MIDVQQDCEQCSDPDTHMFLSTDYPPVWLCVECEPADDGDGHHALVTDR